MAGALDGITVLDLTEGMAGALATMFLCDNGATVIRVGSQESEAERRGPAYAVWDRGKQSVFLDISIAMAGHEAAGSPDADTPEASRERDRFHHLVRSCDVLIESFPPSSAVQALLDYEALASINPRLVRCSITAYGREGPLRDQPADDDLVMARTGILSIQPSPRPGPIHVVHRLPSVGAGILAALGTVAALLAREKRGWGRKVETSLMRGALLFAPKIAGEKLTPRPTRRATVGGGPFYSAFECADRVWIHLGCVHSRFVDRAAVAMGITDVMADPKFGDGRNVPSEEARQELFDIVGGVIKGKPSEDWATLFEEADVPWARVRTVEEGMDDPQVRANDMVIELRDPELGAMSQMGLPVKLSETPGNVRGPRPVPGQDTDTVLSALSERRPRAGYTADPESKALDPPLKGVKVLETANVIAGPTASRLLAELGAEVIKLEPPDGDISRPAAVPYFYYLNSNKRSVSANTRTPQGKEVARRLAARADILLANLRPGATDRMGIGTEVLNELNPGIIQTHVTAFGWTGPYAHRPGLDPLAQALIGLERAQGGPENPPIFLGRVAPTDYTAGAMGALGSVMALFVRERTGLSQRVDTNLLNAGIVVSSADFLIYADSRPRHLVDKEQYGPSALHRLYEARDGWIYLAADTQDQWLALCRALGREDLPREGRFTSEEARRSNDAALAIELAQDFKRRSSEEWLDLLGGSGIPSAPAVEGYDQGFVDDPQAIANDMIVVHQHPSMGYLKLCLNAIRFNNTSEVSGRPTPLLGQHTGEVLEELGYSSSEIEELYRERVVKTEEPPTG